MIAKRNAIGQTVPVSMPATVHPARVYVALGSNLGNTEANLRSALPLLQQLAAGRMKASSIWNTDPEGFRHDVPRFQNAVVAFRTRLEPLPLLLELQRIEREMGRVEKTGERYDSRIIDLDLIDYEGAVLDVPGLILPHPRATERRFVLMPLQEISPDFVFPGQERESLQTLIDTAPANHMELFSPLIPSA